MRTIAKANEEAERLRQAGYSAFLQRVDLGEKGTWQRVYAGPFEDRAEAERAAEDIRSRGFSQYTRVSRVPGNTTTSGR
jgi:cell division septation protein DedD